MNDGDKPVDRTRRVLIGLCLLAAIALIIAFAIPQQPSVSAWSQGTGCRFAAGPYNGRSSRRVGRWLRRR